MPVSGWRWPGGPNCWGTVAADARWAAAAVPDALARGGGRSDHDAAGRDLGAGHPLRAPRLAAWDAHTLSLLTGGRFELGIGTGGPKWSLRPPRCYGPPELTGAQRLARVEQTIDELRALDGDEHTPVLVAAGDRRPGRWPRPRPTSSPWPRARWPAATRSRNWSPAFARRPVTGEPGWSSRHRSSSSGTTPPWVVRFTGTDMATLVARDSLMILRGSPAQMAEELQRRRETLGVSYFSVNAAFIEQFAPVVGLLAGH